MRSTCMLLAMIALMVQGCLFAQVGPPFQSTDASGPVCIWNGETCIMAIRTSDELAELEDLSVFARRNGRIELVVIYADHVPATAIDDLWDRGGTINLPNEKKLTFPPGSKASQAEVRSLMQAEIERTKEYWYHDIEFRGPLPEITSAE